MASFSSSDVALLLRNPVSGKRTILKHVCDNGMLTGPNLRGQVPGVFVKLLGGAGFELDSLFSGLAGATAEDSLEDFLGCVIRERRELAGMQPRHIWLYYRNGTVPPKQADILVTMLRNPHVEQADFPTLRDFLSGQTLRCHYFVALVPSLSALASLALEPVTGVRDVCVLASLSCHVLQRFAVAYHYH